MKVLARKGWQTKNIAPFIGPGGKCDKQKIETSIETEKELRFFLCGRACMVTADSFPMERNSIMKHFYSRKFEPGIIFREAA
jgi:hypothetical protein